MRAFTLAATSRASGCSPSVHAAFETKRINHSEAYSTDDACTSQAESFFSRLRRAEIGQHHHISGPYLKFYAGEMACREDNRRWDNGALFELAGVAALIHPKSRNWCGYWQRADYPPASVQRPRLPGP